MENISLRKVPFLIPLLGFMVGISGWYFLLLLVISLFRGYRVFFLIFFGLGFFLKEINDDRFYSMHYSRHWKEGNYVLMEVGSGRSHKILGLMGTDGCAIKVRGKIGWKGESLKVGGRYWIRGRVRAIPMVDSPYNFDYRKWMAYKNVHYEWIQIDEIREVGKNPVVASSASLRKFILSRFEKIMEDEKSLALVSALILGIRSGMPEEMKSDYVHAGAIHVMAVSGLHVGIIYSILNKLLGFIVFRWRKAVIIPIIWGFGYLTGSAAAVNRAAGMFTWYSFGESHAINTISGTAFILLVLNPNLLFDVGFQLSFSAVLGILIIHPILNKQWKVTHKYLKYFWDLTTVGIGAQLATLPFILYYFNQLPAYFWLSGWLVVPAAAGILTFGLLAAIFPLDVLVYPLRWLVKLTNEGVAKIAQLPGAVIENLYIDLIQGVLIALLIGSLFIVKFRWLWVFGILTLYSGYGLWREVKNTHHYRIILNPTNYEVWLGKRAYSFWGTSGSNLLKFRGLHGIQSSEQIGLNTQWLVPGKVCVEKTKGGIYTEIWGSNPFSFRVMEAQDFLFQKHLEGIIYIQGWVGEVQRQMIYAHCDCLKIDCRILKSAI